MPAISRSSPMAARGRFMPSAVAREIGMRQRHHPARAGRVLAPSACCSPTCATTSCAPGSTRLDDADFDAIEQHLSASSRTRAGARIAAHVGRPAQGRRSSAPPTCAMSARSMPSRSICRWSVFARSDRAAIKRHFDDEHELRYGTCAPEERGRDRQPARDRHRRRCASRRRKRSRRGGRAPPQAAFTGKRAVYFGEARGFGRRRPIARAALHRRQPHQRPGADRGACLDHGADARRRARSSMPSAISSSRSGRTMKRHGATLEDGRARRAGSIRSSPRSCATASSP